MMLSKKLNIDISFAICISLKSDEKRRQQTIEECNKIGLPVKFFLADPHPNGGVEGCKDSHKKVIQYAKDNNLENILVLEDDILFDINAIKNMKPLHCPKNFDMFYLGYHINRGFRIGDQLLQIESALTTHAYIMNKNVYDLFLNFIDGEWNIPEFQDLNQFEKPFFGKIKAVDMFYAKYIHHARGKTYGVYPMIAYQRPEYSQIEKSFVDYKNVFINKANFFAKNIKSTLRCQYIQKDQNNVIEFIKNSNANEYDFFHIQPEVRLNPYNKDDKNINWDVLYINENEYLIRKQACYKKKDSWRIRYLYPGCDLKLNREWISEKPIVCYYGEENETINKLMSQYYVFYCSEKYKEIQNNYIPKHNYNFIPNHRVLLKNDITFFVDHAVTKPNIILWMTKDTFDCEWKCDWWQETGTYKIPFDGKALFTNMSRYITNILFETKEICDKFCEKYEVIFNPSNMVILENGKHNFEIQETNPIPWKIIAETNGKNFMKYIQIFRILKKNFPKFTLDLYGCNKNNKKRSRTIKDSGIKYIKGKIEWNKADLFLMLEDNEEYYWKAKMSTCIVLTNDKYSYMSEHDIILGEELPKINREELKRMSFDYALKQKTNTKLVDFFIKT